VGWVWKIGDFQLFALLLISNLGVAYTLSIGVDY